MSHRHGHLLETIFRDPIPASIHWREVESLLNHIGAEIESLSGGRIRARINRHEGILHRPHHGSTLDKNAVRTLRGFLAGAGVTPALYAARESDKSGAGEG
jgi:hypothetical protein